jgi:multimeric flavodoxin WrbA
MLILAINGSPRPEGSTACVLWSVRQVIESAGAEFIFLQITEVLKGLKAPYCVACSSPCEGKCFQGTLLEETFKLLRRADGMIIGSPVYFSTVSAPLKAFWDRTRSLRREKALLNVAGGAVTVGGARFGGQETTLRAIHDMMLCHGMTVVGDGYLEDDAGHQGVCAQSPAREDEQALKRAQVLAKRVAEVARATQGLRIRSG